MPQEMHMIPIRGGWRRTGLGLLATLVVSIPGPSARATVLVEDAAGENPTVEASTAARWEALAVSSPRSSVDSDDRALSVSLAPGDHAAFSRAADLAPAPSTVLCTFNVQVSDLGVSKPALQVFRMGWNFGTSNADEADATTYARLGLQATAEHGFQLSDLVSGAVSKAFKGTQAVTWALNNSGRPLRYAAPNGSVETLGDDRMDVWVGREKVFDEILAIHPEGRITDLKWFWSQGSGVTRFDHFEVRTLDPAGDGSRAGVADATGAAAPDAETPAADASIALDRPTPNPFSSTMRFAYSIPSGAAVVDIGLFDLAGRRVRSLARGTQVAGQYEVRWDGLGDDGKRVKHGVYFLRAEVGSARRVSRVVYLSE
jgi:hypothetical protein